MRAVEVFSSSLIAILFFLVALPFFASWISSSVSYSGQGEWRNTAGSVVCIPKRYLQPSSGQPRFLPCFPLHYLHLSGIRSLCAWLLLFEPTFELFCGVYLPIVSFAEKEIFSILNEGREEDVKVRVVGTGHSFSPIVCTQTFNGWLVSLDRYRSYPVLFSASALDEMPASAMSV